MIKNYSTKSKARGANAEYPDELPLKGWKSVMFRVYKEIDEDNISLVAAGVSFYALLALFPALAAIGSIYGLVADPVEVATHLESLVGSVPQELLTLVGDQMRELASGRDAALGFSIVSGLLISLWGAAKGLRMLLLALNIAYDQRGKRNIFRQYLDSLAFTFAAVIFCVIVAGVLFGIPWMLDQAAMAAGLKTVLSSARWVLVALMFMAVLAALYRYGPYRATPKWRWVSVGALVATALWLLGSALFTWYVGGSSKYADTYGPVAGVIIVLMWFYLTVLSTLIGAELNSEIERQTAVDSTTGPAKPMGQRGAVVADESMALPNETPTEVDKTVL